MSYCSIDSESKGQGGWNSTILQILLRIAVICICVFHSACLIYVPRVTMAMERRIEQDGNCSNGTTNC